MNYYCKLCVCLNAVGALLNCDGCGHNKVNLSGDLAELAKHSLESNNVIADDLKTGIYKDIGDLHLACRSCYSDCNLHSDH